MLLKELGEEETYYYHPDHLGSVSVVSNHKGEPYERVEHLPFGELWIEETDPATGYIPFRFTSKEYDEETGLYYYGARYYEPRLSRWMSADPAGWELINPNRKGYSVIEATNWYSYVSNNPVKYVDPTGMEGYQQLTDSEQKFVRNHPFAASIARKNAEKASERVSGMDGQHNGKADAMRHAYWSASNTRDLGPEKAKEIGDAHEVVPTLGDVQRMLQSGVPEEEIERFQPVEEREMDLHNNDVGIGIGLNNPDATDDELWNLIEEAWEDGQLKTLLKKNENSDQQVEIPERKEPVVPQKPLLQ